MTFIAEAEDSKTAKTEAAGNSEDIPLPEFFVKSQGLCIQHYAKLITYAKKVPKWLKTFQEDRFKALEERTSRFIEYSAWGRQQDFETLSPADKVVWKELAAALRGNVSH